MRNYRKLYRFLTEWEIWKQRNLSKSFWIIKRINILREGQRHRRREWGGERKKLFTLCLVNITHKSVYWNYSNLLLGLTFERIFQCIIYNWNISHTHTQVCTLDKIIFITSTNKQIKKRNLNDQKNDENYDASCITHKWQRPSWQIGKIH